MAPFPRDSNRVPVIGGQDSSTSTATAATIDHVSGGLNVNIVSEDSLPANAVSGLANTSGTSDTQVIAAQGTGNYIYITSISIANTGATTSLLTIESDTAGAKTAMWYLINPAGGGDNITFKPALRTPLTNTNIGFFAASGSTIQYVSFSGYMGP